MMAVVEKMKAPKVITNQRGSIMNLNSSDYSASYLYEARKMRKSNNTINLVIICITIIIALLLTKDNLCSVEYQHGTQLLSVFLSCHQ